MMKKYLFSFYKVLIVVVLLFGSGKISGQGAETFETQTSLNATYSDGTFAGETSGVNVNYVHSRDQDTFAINGKGLMLRRSDEPSSVEFEIPNGVGSFTFKYRKAFTGGTNNRILAVVVDGVETAVTPLFGAAGDDTTIHTLTTAINKSGLVKVKITYPAGTQTGNKQVTIDGVSWTGYSATPCSGTPSAGSATVSPTSGSPGTDYVVNATGYSSGATGLSYQWQYNINGAGWSNSSPVNIPSSTSYANYNATNDAFAPAVGQSVQWRLVTTCSNGGASNTSSAATYTSVLSYCTPAFSSTSDFIVNFGLGIINNSSEFSPNGYGDFTSLSTNLIENSSYNASLTPSNGSGNHGIAIWIDFNNNGTFETGERVGSLPNNVGPTTPVSIPVTIPSGNIGTHRMRVIYQYNLVGTAIDPCVSATFGEAEDYTVNIIAACIPPTDPVGTISGTTPTCTTTVLTYTGADSATAYWQTTATGTSVSEPVSSTTKTVSTSGTYYVRIYSGTCWSTNSKNLNVVINDAPSITTQPANQIVYVGTQATFSVVATGTGLTYQWQVDKGAGFANVTGADGTATTSSFQTVATTLAMTGYKYRVNITGTCGNLASDGLAVLTVSSTPVCTPIWEENFDYGCTDNSNLTSLTPNWTIYSGFSNDFKYNASGLTYSGYASSGIGGAANLQLGSGDDIGREFSPTGITSGSVYASFLINMDSGTTTTNDYFISLADASGGFQGRVYILKSGTQFKLGVSKQSSSTANTTTSNLNFGTTYLVVIKYEMQNLAGNTDPFKLWVVSSGVPSSEASAGTPISASVTGTDATNLKYFVLRQMGSFQGLVDGIRVGTTWSDVVCAGAVAPPVDTYTWTGSGNSTLWTNACNWSPRGIPGATDNVIFNTAPTYKLNITDSRTVKDFTLNETGAFKASATGILTINGNVTYGGSASATLDCDSQIFIKSTTLQPIPSLTYGNLDVLGGPRVFPNGGTIKICGGFNVVPDPSTSIYTVTGSTVEYISPASGWVMTPFTYNNLTFSGLGDFSVGYSTTNTNKTINVLGNYLQSAGIVYLGENSTATATLNVDGDMTISDGDFRLNQISGGTGIVNLKGDLSVSNTAQFTSKYATGKINFVGIGDGSTDALTQSIDLKNPNSVYYTTLSVNSGFTKLINQDLHLGTNSSFDVRNGATFNFGYAADNLTALNIVRVSSPTMRTGQAFTSYNGSTLKITSPDGISNVTSVYTGNVQIGADATKRTFAPDATYHYIGKANAAQVIANGVDQISGNGLPSDASVKNVIIELDATNPAQDNVSFKAIGINKFSSAGLLKIIKGKVVDEFGNGFADGTFADGNLTMTGGRYKILRSDLQPSLGGIYDLQGGVIEFAQSTTGIQIRTGASANPKEYYKIDVSGTNVEPSGKNLMVKQTTTITPSGYLTIPTTADNAASNVLWSKKGIVVSNSGTALFGSGAQLMQDVDAVNGGNITMQRNTKMQKMDYTYWSSPVSGQVLKNTLNGDLETSSGGFSPTTPNTRIFDYVEATDLFKATADANFVEGKGYAIRGKNAFVVTGPDTYQFLGQPTNGSSKNNTNPLTIKIYKSKKSFVGGIEYEHGFNMIGNPYPSNIDFYKFYDLNKPIINAKAWFWTNVSPHLTMEGSNYNGNNYATVTLTGGAPPTSYDPYPSTGGYKPTNFIKVGQGFIVQAKADVTGPTQEFTLNFNNDIRDTGIGVFYNNPNKNEGVNRFWVRLRSPLDIINTILIGHFGNATDGYDNDYDAELLTVGDDSFYTVLSNKKLQIQAVGVFNENDIFPVFTKSSMVGSYTFEIEDPEGLFASGQPVYLHDKLTGTYTNLNQENYSYQAVKGFTENRFEIMYKTDSVLSTGDNTKDELQVYRNGEDFIVQSRKGSIDEVEVFDASGRLFQKVKGGTTKVVVDGKTLVNGMYILKIKRKTDLVSKKIMK